MTSPVQNLLPGSQESGIRLKLCGLFTRTLLTPIQGHTVDTRSTFGVSLKTHNCHHHHHHHHTPASSNWLPSGVIISPPALLSFPSTSMFLLKNKEHSANSSLYSSLYFNVITCLNSGRCENHVQKQLHFNVQQLAALCQQHPNI